MVQPIEREKNTKHTLEERLAQKFDDLQLAREERVPHLFDELERSIEVLLRAVPQAYEDLILERQQLDAELNEAMYQIGMEARQAQDSIHRNAIIDSKSGAVEWEYREALEESIVDILQKHGLITMMRPSRAQLESVQPPQPQQQIQPQTPQNPIQQQAPQIPPQQPSQPQPQQKKPHLISKKVQKQKFEV